MNTELPIETHPWPPFIPPKAKILIMGTFPPKAMRWSMDFYYPNKINDFWRIIGLIFLGDKNALLQSDGSFNLPEIISLLTNAGIALNDTGHQVRRLKDNASDKFLEIVQETNLHTLLAQMPMCRAVATTGEKAACVIASQTHTPIPKMGEMIMTNDGLEVWRMPSTSRAYPLALEKKAEYYYKMLQHLDIVK